MAFPCFGPAGIKTEVEAVLQRGQANKEGELCVQAIFVLLDVLKKWSEGAQSSSSWLASGVLGARRHLTCQLAHTITLLRC